MIPPVQGVIFDYGLTLVSFVDPEAAVGRAITAVACRLVELDLAEAPQALGIASMVAAELRTEIASHERSGALDEIDHRTLIAHAYRRAGLLLPDEALQKVVMAEQEAWWDSVQMGTTTVAVLTRLRAAGIRVGVCSNAPYDPPGIRAQLDHLGLTALLDSVTLSSEVGRRKPAPEIFAAALADLGTPAAGTVFVGDRRHEDVGGARRAGLRTMRTREFADDTTGDTAEADHVVDILADILPHLRC